MFEKATVINLKTILRSAERNRHMKYKRHTGMRNKTIVSKIQGHNLLNSSFVFLPGVVNPSESILS